MAIQRSIQDAIIIVYNITTVTDMIQPMRRIEVIDDGAGYDTSSSSKQVVVMMYQSSYYDDPSPAKVER